jgi:hypothetical protein
MQEMADSGNRPLLLSAERALAALGGSLASKPDDMAIETNARSLRGLASIVEGLHNGLRQCGGADCMGYGRDGIRTWVRSEDLGRMADRARRAEARVDELEAALARILDQAATGENALAMAWDWDVIAAGMAAQARDVLAASCNQGPGE